VSVKYKDREEFYLFLVYNCPLRFVTLPWSSYTFTVRKIHHYYATNTTDISWLCNELFFLCFVTYAPYKN